MNKFFEKALSVFLGAAVLTSMSCPALADSLPSVDDNHCVITYPRATLGRVYALDNNNRWIDSSDDCQILSVDGDRVYVSYPTKNGRHCEWFTRDAFTTCEINWADCPTITASGTITAYRQSTGADKLGTLSANDTCYVLTKQGSRTQLVYPISNGRYKMGWVDSSAIYGDKFTTSSFTVHTVIDTGKVLDVYGWASDNGTNIQLYTKHGGENQQFAFVPKGDYFAIINTGNGKAVDVTGGVSNSEVNVQLYDVNYSDAQLWQFETAGDKEYYVKNKLGYYLDAAGGTANDENNVWVYERNETPAQKWKIKSVSNSSNDTLAWSENNVGQVIANLDGYSTDLDGFSGIKGQCVWYVRNRGYEKLGNSGLTGISGNANKWYSAAGNKGLSRGETPRTNSIACWNGGSYGHVAFVEYYDEATETVYFTEANWKGGSATNGQLKKLSLNEFKSRKGSYKGCIYLG